MNQEKCDKCGENLVCPKCTPVIEHTNAIIIRYKDTTYNGGYPNSLSIIPVYVTDEGDEVSVAVLTGDNFYEGHTYYGARSVDEMARFLAEHDANDIIQMFSVKRSQKRPVQDLLSQLKEYVKNSLPMSEGEHIDT